MAYLITFLLVSLWTIRSLKAELFWLYLLQLKEYKLKRLIDHFHTEKGQRILLDKIVIVKIILALLSSFISLYLTDIVLVIYLAESLFAMKSAYEKRIIKPVITSKSIPLIGILAFMQLAFGGLAVIYSSNTTELARHLLVYDIWVPIIAMLVVMSLKPLNIILRNRIINAAKKKRAELKDLLVIGITGSYGKTSTKEFLYETLKDKFNVIRTPEHVNTEIGVADFVLNKLSVKHEIFICEMGAYEKGEVKETADIVKPKIGIFLGANEQHLSLFGSMENLLKAEGGEELLEALPKRGLAIFNGNNKYAYELYKKAEIPKRITYAPNLIEIINPEKRDVRAENISAQKDNITFKVFTNKNSKGIDFKVNLLGTHNVENILLCVALAEELGMTLMEIKEAIKKIYPLTRTMSMTKNEDGVTIINSTYSSNPTAVEAHLEYLKVWDKEPNPTSLKLRRARKIVVMPCLIELGSASSKVHEAIGKSLARVADLTIVTTKDKLLEIQRGAERAIGENAAKGIIVHIENVDQILEKIKSITGKGDVILLEGRLPQKLVESLEK